MRTQSHQDAVDAVEAIHAELGFDQKIDYDNPVTVERHLNWLLYERRHAARAQFAWRQFAEERLVALMDEIK